ncbi:hypothetical protein B0G80_2930 [Paraburkholderia sp. BL6669N2]|nr:hypothetical protein B0G80_2930 [Paraburkholderia sp. BL6669N2]
MPGRRARRTHARVSVRFWREALKRKLICAARPRAAAVANTVGRRAARAAFVRRPVLALCQSAAFGRIDNVKDGVGSNRVRRGQPLVCGRRAFYGLMTFDETGVLRAQAAWFSWRSGEAERHPLHPIRVIPAREVSGSSQSSIPRRAASVIGSRIARPASPAGFVLGTSVLLPYGKDSMTAYSSDMCFALRHAAVGAPCFSFACRPETECAR